jgi:hypothetical protein
VLGFRTICIRIMVQISVVYLMRISNGHRQRWKRYTLWPNGIAWIIYFEKKTKIKRNHLYLPLADSSLKSFIMMASIIKYSSFPTKRVNIDEIPVYQKLKLIESRNLPPLSFNRTSPLTNSVFVPFLISHSFQRKRPYIKYTGTILLLQHHVT